MNTEKFTNYLQRKNLSPSSITHYIRCVEVFFREVVKEDLQVTKADILGHLKYLKEVRGQQNITRKNNLIALHHYFSFLYQTEQVTTNPCVSLKIRGTKKRILHRIYNPTELLQLNDNYHHLFVDGYDDSHMPLNQRGKSFLSRHRNTVMLNLLIHQGMTTREVDSMTLEDIELKRAVIRIRGSKKSNARTIPLDGTQVGLLMHYTEKIRPQFLEYAPDKTSNKVFLPLPDYSKQHTENESVEHIFKPLAKQVKSFEPSFQNFKQIRASVITQWLKTQGLRKTQYLAGHRYISSTEQYRPNDLDGLIDDITNLHPYC